MEAFLTIFLSKILTVRIKVSFIGIILRSILFVKLLYNKNALKNYPKRKFPFYLSKYYLIRNLLFHLSNFWTTKMLLNIMPKKKNFISPVKVLFIRKLLFQLLKKLPFLLVKILLKKYITIKIFPKKEIFPSKHISKKKHIKIHPKKEILMLI